MRLEIDHDHVSIRSIVLLPLAGLYGLGWWTYELWYRLGLKRPEEAHRPVVVVGNLQVGGMGKTPVTVEVARALQRLGRSVVVSANGYGSPMRTGANLAPEGPLAAPQWGDEPALLRDLLPGVPVIVGRDRLQAARLCHQRYPEAVLVMDDGFQHKPVRKHLSLLLDPQKPGNPLLLPAGPYRQPRSQRSRADAVLPEDFPMELYPPTYLDAAGHEVHPTRGEPIQMLTAIARPWRFQHTLERAGLEVKKGLALPDHDPLTQPELLASFDPQWPIFTTEKDWVKLRERTDLDAATIIRVRQNLAFRDRNQFEQWLLRRLNEIST